MIKSMTAFGRAKCENENKSVTVEIKSVNSRFFDCNVKLPRAYSALEERIRSCVQKNAVSRARVEVYLTVENLLGSSSVVSVDMSYAESYIKAVRQLAEGFGLRDDVSAMSVARNPEIFKTEKPDEDMEADWLLIKEALDAAISGFAEMRKKEGAKIEADIKGKIELVREYADKVEEISKSDTVGYRDKLEAKLRAILADNSIEIDENRLLTECAVWADKIAIDEELVRLRSHFGAFRAIFESDEPVGRRLDFLTQELNREINTIGSKSANSAITRKVVDVKCELEKIREQIQNIE